MPLAAYRRKRQFGKTPEPRGASARLGSHEFVIQKHAARTLHYDFRLELGGVLLSWAIPKGPSLDPAAKRLAVQTEDHPVEYATFEGTIPEGEYGGGEVIVWDRGTWEAEGDAKSGYQRGRMTFKLEGSKLRGGFRLIRTNRHSGRNAKAQWLLIKQSDELARPGSDSAILEERPGSVLSGRDVGEVPGRTSRSVVPRVTRARRGGTHSKPSARSLRALTTARLPKFISPELATLATAVPEGDAWLHETKLDGYRLIARIVHGEATLLSRRGNDWTARLPALASAVGSLPVGDAMLDGELVVLDEHGISDFQRLQNSLDASKEEACTYFVFDAPFLDGKDLRDLPLTERKALLSGKLPRTGPVRFGEHSIGDGQAFFESACRRGLEGIVSKRSDAPYVSRRTRDWLKVKCTSGQEFVVGGFTEPTGSRSHFGALLLGVQGKHGLEYAGKVGTGFSRTSLRAIAKRMKPLEREQSPFIAGPAVPRLGRVHWLAPELVAEVSFTERTRDGLVRHATFKGLREDKPAMEVETEKPVAAPSASKKSREQAAGRPAEERFPLTHPDRVLWRPDITKADLARYYADVASSILPHLVERPLMLVRCPEGAHAQCFHQKHPSKGMPQSIARVRIAEKKGQAEALIVRDLDGLIGLVQLGVLEIHTWGSRVARPEFPDQLVFDLDPDVDLPWQRVVEAATELRSRLNDLGLGTFLKTTGGKGLHVVVPVVPDTSWDDAKRFCQDVVEGMARDAPKRYVATMSKEKRRGRVFLDYLRNARGATSVCAYSPRSIRGAPVSVPLDWTELTPDLDPSTMNVRTVPVRLANTRDPWAGFEKARTSIRAVSGGRSD